MDDDLIVVLKLRFSCSHLVESGVIDREAVIVVARYCLPLSMETVVGCLPCVEQLVVCFEENNPGDEEQS